MQQVPAQSQMSLSFGQVDGPELSEAYDWCKTRSMTVTIASVFSVGVRA